MICTMYASLAVVCFVVSMKTIMIRLKKDENDDNKDDDVVSRRDYLLTLSGKTS